MNDINLDNPFSHMRSEQVFVHAMNRLMHNAGVLAVRQKLEENGPTTPEQIVQAVQYLDSMVDRAENFQDLAGMMKGVVFQLELDAARSTTQAGMIDGQRRADQTKEMFTAYMEEAAKAVHIKNPLEFTVKGRSNV